MPDLRQFLTLSDLRPFFDNVVPDEDYSEERRQQYLNELDTIVVPALGSFFKALRAEGRLTAIPDSEGYSTRLWNAWNEVARQSSDELSTSAGALTLTTLAKHFAHQLTFDIVWPYECVLKSDGGRAAAALDKNIAFEEVVQRFNAGNYRPSELFSFERCSNTGLPLNLEFKAWKPTGCHITKRGFVAIQPLAGSTIRETVLELKTGNLLIQDWFRIPEFTQLVRAEGISLDSREGRADHACYLADQFGVVSVSVGNSSPAVYQDGNLVIVGRGGPENGPVPDRFHEVGRVFTELWAATLVEYETLVELVARTRRDTAKEIVEAYLEDQEKVEGSGLHRLTVTPGRYYLYHFGDHDAFATKAAEVGVVLDAGDIAPFFMLSPVRLFASRAG